MFDLTQWTIKFNVKLHGPKARILYTDSIDRYNKNQILDYTQINCVKDTILYTEPTVIGAKSYHKIDYKSQNFCDILYKIHIKCIKESVISMLFFVLYVSRQLKEKNICYNIKYYH